MQLTNLNFLKIRVNSYAIYSVLCVTYCLKFVLFNHYWPFIARPKGQRLIIPQCHAWSLGRWAI